MPLSTMAEIAQNRKTCKAFDPNRTIPAAEFAELEQVMRNAASSVNSQPWHYVVASTAAGKKRVSVSTQGDTAYNLPKVLNCSHIVVFCRKLKLETTAAETILQQEIKDGRFANDAAIEAVRKTRNYYFDQHFKVLKDGTNWMEKQVYLSYGMVMFAAASMGINSCPMEGFDNVALDQELALADQGLASVVLLALGYGSSDDFNANLPKSRLPAASIFTHI